MPDMKCVFRNFAIPVPTFDYMKNFQRSYQARFGVKLTNTQVLILILAQHQHMIEAQELKRQWTTSEEFRPQAENA